MLICLWCGKSYPDNTPKCPICGHLLKKEESVEAPIPEPNKDEQVTDL